MAARVRTPAHGNASSILYRAFCCAGGAAARAPARFLGEARQAGRRKRHDCFCILRTLWRQQRIGTANINHKERYNSKRLAWRRNIAAEKSKPSERRNINMLALFALR